MAKTICRVLLGIAVLYAGAVTAFAFLHYEGDRPGAGEVLGDFHAWIGLGSGSDPEPPPPPPPPPPEPVLPPTPEPEPTTTPEPSPTVHTTAEEDADVDAAEKALKAAEESAKTLRAMGRGPEFDAKLRETLGLLGTCREILNHVLEANPSHPRANKIWDRLQAVHGAVRHY